MDMLARLNINRPLQQYVVITVALLTLIVTLLLSPFASANTESLSLLDALQQKTLSRHKPISGTFKQFKHITVLPAPLVSEGEFTISPNEALWKTTLPIASSLIINNKGLQWNKSTPANKNPSKDRSTAEKTIAKLFLTALRGDISQLRDFFTIEAEGSIDLWTLSLTPKEKQFQAYLQVIKISGTEFTDKIQIQETNGDKTEILLTTMPN